MKQKGFNWNSCLLIFAFFGALTLWSPAEAARTSRILKFQGVPANQGAVIRREFPFVFEREVTLAEVDQIVRFLMRNGAFSNVEVVERDAGDGSGRELVLQATQQRKILKLDIVGANALSASEVTRLLGVTRGQIFERKNLLASAEDLRRVYESIGYLNAQVEIEFDTPSENEVDITVKINEGQPMKISEIVIDSANSDLSSRVSKMARGLKGKTVTEESILDFGKNVGEYLQKNSYLTARLGNPNITFNPDRTQAKLNYVIENPWKFDIRFDGNFHFSSGDLIEQIESEKLSGTLSSPAPDMAEKIRRMYQGAGYANVEVTYEQKLIEADRILQLRFSIAENARVRIQKIEIAGNISRPGNYYAQFIKSSSSDLIGKGYYNRKDVEEGAKKLVTELQNQGYLRAKVQSQRAEYSNDKTTVTIYLNIDEGPLTQIRQIRIEGVDSFPRAQILELLKIRTGAALGLQELEESIQALKNFYRSEGYLEMRLLNEEQSKIVTYNDANTQATVDFKIYEGPRVIVGTIAPEGNFFTKDYVILRELPFKTGDVLTPEKIDEAIFRLQKLGLFTGVSLRSLEEGTNIAERTIIIRVEEGIPGVFTTGFGVNNDYQLTFRGYLSIAYRNLYGTGRAASLRVDPRYSTDPRISYVEHTITFSYLEPYIFGDRNRGRVNLVREQAYDPLYSTSSSTIISEGNSIGLLIERDLTRHIKLTWTGYSFANQRRFDRSSYNDIELQNIAKVGPLVEFDYRDDVFNTTRGSYAMTNLEYSDPVLGSSKDATQTIHFLKASGSYTLYSPLNTKRSLVWANSVRGGYVANLSSDANSGVPAQEAFFLGGRSTIRGFDPGAQHERIPNKYDLGVGEYRNFRVTSDSHYYLVKTELRFPIYGSLGGAFFYDGGAVILSQRELPTPYRDAVGFGLRIATPVGPLNLELGWKLNRRRVAIGQGGEPDIWESPWAFHFSIGAF